MKKDREKDKEDRMLEQRNAEAEEIQKEAFRLPHVVETETRDGRMAERLTNVVDNGVEDTVAINHSGNVVKPTGVVGLNRTLMDSVNSVLNNKIRLVIIVVIVVLLMVAFFKIIRTQKSIETMLKDDGRQMTGGRMW